MKKLLKNLILFLIQLIETYEYRKLKLDKNDPSKKIINSLESSFFVDSDTGYEPVSNIHITQPYHIYKIITSSGKYLECADNHILFNENMNEIFCQELCVGDNIQTKDGIEKIEYIKKLKFKVSMFDITVSNNYHRYYSNDILSHNTVTSSIFIAWYLCFHFDRNILVLANKMNTTMEIIDKIRVVYKNLPFFLKPGVSSNGATGMRFDNGVRLFSQATTKTAAIGFTIHVLYADEFAHIPANYLIPFYRSIYPTLSSSQISRIIISSTPNGMNLFYDIYSGALEGKNEYAPFRVDWWEVPGRDEKWKQKEIANLGSEELFNQEYGNQFLAASRMLLTSDVLMYIKRTSRNYKWKEVNELDDLNDNYAELKWHPDFNPNTINIDKDKFVFSIDVGDGVGNDYTVCNIFKLELQSLSMIRKIQTYEDESAFFRLRQVGMWRSNIHSVDDFSRILEALIFKVFHQDIVRVVLEINFKGNVVIEKLSRNPDYYPEIFMHTLHSLNAVILKPGVKVKSDNKEMYSRELKNLIKQKYIIVNETKTFNELGAFGLNKNGKYEAQTGHDDCAMSLINLVSFFENDVFYEFVEDIVDKQPEIVRTIINKKMDELPYDNETVQNMKWLQEYM